MIFVTHDNWLNLLTLLHVHQQKNMKIDIYKMAVFLGKTGKDLGSDLASIASFIILKLTLCLIVFETSNKAEEKFCRMGN